MIIPSIYRHKISIIIFIDNFISIHYFVSKHILIEKNIDKSYRSATLIYDTPPEPAEKAGSCRT